MRRPSPRNRSASDPREKTALGVECGVRHPPLAVMIGAANFSPEKALPVLVPCVLTFVLVAAIYMAIRGRAASAAAKPAGTGAIS